MWHDGLIFKLQQTGISGSLLKVFKNGFQSDYSIIESGVPQCSDLGPLLFLIYIDDLERNIKFFVDDTMLFCIVKDPAISANNLNMICDWAHQWKIEFSSDPNNQANAILFSCKKSSPNKLNKYSMELPWLK